MGYGQVRLVDNNNNSNDDDVDDEAVHNTGDYIYPASSVSVLNYSLNYRDQFLRPSGAKAGTLASQCITLYTLGVVQYDDDVRRAMSASAK